MSLNIEKIRNDFPTLNQEVHGKPLIYLDNAATTQKPRSVIEKAANFYKYDNANVHRGVHTLSSRATHAFEETRSKIQAFINAKSTDEIIYTRGTTESINLVAQSYGRTFINEGDEIIVSAMEHHSNIVPWQQLCESNKAVLKVIPMNEKGELILEAYEKLLNNRTKIVAVTHISNALGTINPLKKIISLAHEKGAIVLIDGAQAIPHTKVDVQDLDCDFYALSAHKAYGPTGIGILYGKKELLEKMPPWQHGGDMIKMVSFEKTIYNDLPYKFEAGTPNIVGAVAFGSTIDYLNQIGMNHIADYEHQLLDYATDKANNFPGLKIIGSAQKKAAVLSFILESVHAHDIGTILDTQGIAIRAGHHCAMPTMKFFGVAATVRASFSFYNTRNDVDRLFEALQYVNEVFNPCLN